MLKFKKGDEVIVTGFINSRAEELGTLGEVGIEYRDWETGSLIVTGKQVVLS